MQTDSDISTFFLLLAAALIYPALIIISGGAVYAIYGTVAQSALSGKAVGRNTTTCPVVTCPTITCKEPACIPSLTTPPCFTTPAPKREPCMEALPCPNGTCRARTCPTLRPAPPISVFFTSVRDTKTVGEWLNMYPPYSKSRLIVVTTLLQDSIEPWALAGFIHRCTASDAYPLRETTCNFCQDRYDYVQCIMSNNLVYEPQRYAATDESYFNEAEFSRIRRWLPDVILNDPPWRPEELDNIFLHIERAIQSFSVKTDVEGKSCNVCNDFNRSIYDGCFSKNGVRYSFPFV